MKIRTLSENFQVKAATELNEDPNKVEENIDLLRDWVKKQPHLIARQDDHFLLCFLRGCKFNLHKAKQKVDNFYTVRANLPEYFADRSPFAVDIQAILNVGGVLPLTNPSGTTGSRVLCFRWALLNPSTMPFTSVIRLMYMILDILLEEDDHTVISGIHILPDYKSFPIGYTTQFTPTNIHKCLLGIQSAYPLRLKGMDFINVPSVLDAFLSLIKSLLSTKFKERTRVHTDKYIPVLYEHIPQNVLPKEYGGTGESLEDLKVKWKNKIESYSKWFEEDQNYYCNDNLRPEGTKNDIFGVDGTFKKLDID